MKCHTFNVSFLFSVNIQRFFLLFNLDFSIIYCNLMIMVMTNCNKKNFQTAKLKFSVISCFFVKYFDGTVVRSNAVYVFRF